MLEWKWVWEEERHSLFCSKPAETPAQLLKNSREQTHVTSEMPWEPCGIKQGVLWGLSGLSLHWGWAGGLFSWASTGVEALMSRPTFPGSVVGGTAL